MPTPGLPATEEKALSVYLQVFTYSVKICVDGLYRALYEINTLTWFLITCPCSSAACLEMDPPVSTLGPAGIWA